jgi:CheY-like chemotaxis protein
MATSPSLSPHILLVDDSRDGLLVRRALLEEAGYRVALAASGEAALELLYSSTFDVVVTDYRMPVMNGTELIIRIRQQNPAARIILLAGFIEPVGLTEQNTGADAIIVKSCHEPNHLVRAVRRLANRAPARKPPSSQKKVAARVRTAAL